MFETHCHINFGAFPKKEVPQVVERFLNAGGEKLICVGAKLDSSQRAIELAANYECVFASVGIHPHHIDTVVSWEETEKELLLLAKSKKVVGVGEAGKDYKKYKDYPPVTPEQKNRQERLFLLHINIAEMLDLPLIVHCREAQDDLLATISEEAARGRKMRGVFHCFDGTPDYLKEVLSLGFYIGFDGNITYPANEHLRELVRLTPLERILTETDAPYLTPQIFRGSRNEPAYLKYVIEGVSKVKGLSYNEVEVETTRNARQLFRI